MVTGTQSVWRCFSDQEHTSSIGGQNRGVKRLLFYQLSVFTHESVDRLLGILLLINNDDTSWRQVVPCKVCSNFFENFALKRIKKTWQGFWKA